MSSRPRPKWTALFSLGCVVKLFALTFLAINVTWHGIIALFIGGPFGLGAYLLVVAILWVGAWMTMRRSHEASVEERRDPIQLDEVKPDHHPVGTGGTTPGAAAPASS